MAKDLVFSDISVEDEAVSLPDFQQRLQMIGPVGFTEFRTLYVADYEYERCVIRSLFTADSDNRPALEELSLSVDVPDVIDRGVLSVTIGGDDVSFARPYRIVPEIVPSQKGGTTTATPRISGETTTGFHVELKDADGANVAGVVSWVAVGY